jgi:23S rRNA (uracil-5-)-methyltransferase RumA
MDRELTVTITGLDAKGHGIATTERGTILVPFTVPGDTVRVILQGKRKGVWHTTVLERTNDAPARVAPRCPYVGQCGGCPWQMIDYPSQLRYKQAAVSQALTDLALPEIPDVVACPDPFYFRNRMDYAVGSKGELGLKATGQWWNVLDLSTCFLLSPEAVTIMAQFREWMRAHQVIPWNNRTHQGFARYLVIREGKRTGERMVHVVTGPGELPGRDDLIARFRNCATSILWGINPRITDLSIADTIHVLHGSDVLHERLDINVDGSRRSLTFEIPPNAFFQTNTAMAERLVETVREFATVSPTDLAVDLYCGVGVFGIALAPDVGRVIGVESEPSAISVAQRNAAANGVTNAQFVLAKSEAWSFPIDPIDILVIDPPRSGLHPRVIQKILALLPKRIVYVSCNPAALARDLPQLLPRYTCTAIRCLDLFPHSPHVETVVRLTRTDRG